LGVLRILDKQHGLRAHAGPGHWNDPDMLEVGNGMSVNEDRAHFSMWAMLAAPLLAGNDLRNMSEETRRILTNAEVVAVDQDELGVQGFRALDEGDLEIWYKPLVDGDWAVCILNRSKATLAVEVDWSEHHVADGLSDRRTEFDTISYRIRDLWSGDDLGTTGEPLVTEVPGHDVLMVRLVRRPTAAE
jgi:alpha-galactosidase